MKKFTKLFSVLLSSLTALSILTFSLPSHSCNLPCYISDHEEIDAEVNAPSTPLLSIEKVDYFTETAIYCKIYGLVRGEFGYSKNYNVANDLVEKWVHRKSKTAIKIQKNWTEQDHHGFDETTNISDFYYIILGNEDHEYEKDFSAKILEFAMQFKFRECRNFIEERIDMGSEYALRRKIWGLIEGSSGFGKNPIHSNLIIEKILLEYELRFFLRNIEEGEIDGV